MQLCHSDQRKASRRRNVIGNFLVCGRNPIEWFFSLRQNASTTKILYVQDSKKPSSKEPSGNYVCEMTAWSTGSGSYIFLYAQDHPDCPLAECSLSCTYKISFTGKAWGMRLAPATQNSTQVLYAEDFQLYPPSKPGESCTYKISTGDARMIVCEPCPNPLYAILYVQDSYQESLSAPGESCTYKISTAQKAMWMTHTPLAVGKLQASARRRRDLKSKMSRFTKTHPAQSGVSCFWGGYFGRLVMT